MVSLAILSGVVVTVIASLNYHLKTALEAKETVAAALLGKNRLEEIKLAGKSDQASGSFISPFENFSWRLDSLDTELQDVKRLEFEVVWDRKELRLVSYAIRG